MDETEEKVCDMCEACASGCTMHESAEMPAADMPAEEEVAA